MRKVIGGLIVVGLLLAACANPVAETGLADSVSVGVSVQESDIAVAVDDVVFYQSMREIPGSGFIAPNSQNADFPGIFFFWDDNAQSDGILKVEAGYFEDFNEFILTIKYSSVYWDFLIKLQKKQKQTPDYSYTFLIPGKIFSSRGIGPVFLNDWVESSNIYYRNAEEPALERDAISFTLVVKDVRGRQLGTGEWYGDVDAISFEIWDEDGHLIADGLKPGPDGKVTYESDAIVAGRDYIVREILGEELLQKYAIPENDMRVSQANGRNFTIFSGKAAPEGNVPVANIEHYGAGKVNSWNDELLSGGDAELFQAILGIMDEEGNSPGWIWNMGADMGANPESAIIATEEFFIPSGSVVPDTVYFHFACDNAAVVYVNGQWAACTSRAFGGGDEGRGIRNFNFQTVDFWAGIEWAHVYQANIAPMLREGPNTIKIYAANSGAGDESVTGLIYASSFTVGKAPEVNEFVNEVKEYYSFWAGINLTITEAGGGTSAATATMIGDEAYMTGSGWQTYIRVDGLSKYSPMAFDLITNDVVVGKATLGVSLNEQLRLVELVVTVELYGGRTIRATNEDVKIMISRNQEDVLNQGNYLYKAIPPELVDGKYVITIPANHVGKVQGKEVSAFNLFTYRD